ncbi:MAG: putative multidrug ABC transporter ATP-binding protein YbhF [Phycisphaerae bacterium]|nr:putative multidrug ABC transporter ATP-binding protein YbhF [Phycisphaerae bacterium]
MPAIQTDKLTRAFSGVRAVDGLTLQVEPGEIFGLVGPDGAGKTTTMRLLTAIMTPSDGRAWVNGRDVVKDAEALKADIGYMSQRFGLYEDLTVIENLRFYADIYLVPRQGLDARMEELLGFSNLTPFRNRLAGNLSGGMKQKLGLACSLIHTPKVLFLDEPTNGVDPVSRRDFWRILYRLLRQGVTIFVSTAYLDEAERCSRVGLIDRGRLLACGRPDEVKRLMTGSILSVGPADPRRAVDLLRKDESLHALAVGLFGEQVHVVTRDAESAERQIRALLASAAIDPGQIEPVEPTLEDVFVSVLAHVEEGLRPEGSP